MIDPLLPEDDARASCAWRASMRRAPRSSGECYRAAQHQLLSYRCAGFRCLNGVKFKLAPKCLVYSLQWQHNGTAPDLHLQLVCAPQLWFDRVASSRFGALNRHDPHLFDALRAH